MPCEGCGREVGKCAPTCPYVNVLYMDEFLKRKLQTGHPSIDTRGGLDGADKSLIFTPIYDLDTFRQRKSQEGDSNDE